MHIYYQYGKRGGKQSIEELVAIAIGYPDEKAKANKFRSNRMPFDEVVTWHGL